MKRFGFVGLCFALALAVRTVQAQDEPTFSLDIGGLPCDSTVPGQGVFSAEADVVLMTEDNPFGPDGAGAQGYSISVGTEGVLSITDVTVAGTVSDFNVNGGITLLNGLVDLQLTSGAGNEGAVIAVVFSTGMQAVTLPGEGTETVAKLAVEGEFPAAGETESGRVFVTDGRQGTGEPVANAIAWTGEEGATKSVKPELGDCSITLEGQEGPVSCCDADVSMYIQNGVLPAIGPDAPQEIWGFTAGGDPLPAAPNARLVPDVPFAQAVIPCEDFESEGEILAGGDSERVWVGLSSNGVTNPVTGELADGVQGWSVSVEVDGDIFPPEDQGADFVTDFILEILENSVLQERQVFTPAPAPGAGFAMGGLGLDGAEVIDPAAQTPPGRKGVVSFGVLSQRQPVTLPGTSSATILNVSVEPEMEPTDEDVVGRVFVSDLLKGSGEPVPTIATVDRETAPVCPAQPVRVVFQGTPPVGAFIRCDPNNDGKNNIADAIWMLNETFRGGPATACPEAADCNSDGTRSDVSDAVFAVMYQFEGGPAPSAPFPDCGIDETITAEDCPEGTTLCP